MLPGGNRGGRHETPPPDRGKWHARSHDNHPSPEITREPRSCLTRQPLIEKREQRNRPWPVEVVSLTANSIPSGL